MLHVCVTWLYWLCQINVISYYEHGDKFVGQVCEAWMRKAGENWPEGIVHVKIFKKLRETL